MSADTCDEDAQVYHDGEVLCDLPAGHDGLHYCELYDVSWKKGRP